MPVASLIFFIVILISLRDINDKVEEYLVKRFRRANVWTSRYRI